MAGALLSHYGSDVTTLEFNTRMTGLMEGQSILVNLSDFGLTNKQMLISQVGITDNVDGYSIWYHVVCVGSPIESVQWQTFWQNLILQSDNDPTNLSDISDGSVLAELFTFTATLSWTGTVTLTKNICPICGPATTCGPARIIC